MKSYGKLKLAVFSLMIALMMLFGMSLTVHADRTIPTKVRGYSGQINYINMTLNKAEYIKVTSAKNLKYKVTNESWSTADYSANSYAEISYYPAKAGTYSIAFSIYNKKTGKKVSSRTIKAYVHNDSPIKQILINGKSSSVFQSYLTTAKTVTFKVQMNSGYTLKKLEIGTYTKPKTVKKTESSYTTTTTSNEMTYKTFKNGAKITLGTRGYYYYYHYNYAGYNGSGAYESCNTNSSMTASTNIRITYVDKYTKLETTTYYSFTRWA